jgi:TRAP-type C4-dicarboxylate transport system permease small subunit
MPIRRRFADMSESESAGSPLGMKRRRGVVDRIAGAMNALAGLVLIAMPVAITTNVLSRYFFNRPFAAVFEGIEYSMLWITFLALPLVTLRKEHIRIDLVEGLIEKRPSAERVLRVLDHIGALVSVVVLLTLAYFTYRTVARSYEMGTVMVTTLKPPRWIIYSVLPTASVVGAVAFIVQRFTESRDQREASTSVLPVHEGDR